MDLDIVACILPMKSLICYCHYSYKKSQENTWIYLYIFNKTGTIFDVKEQKHHLQYSSQMVDL